MLREQLTPLRHGGHKQYTWYSSWLLVWNPIFLDPTDCVFGHFGLAALLRLPHLKFLFVCLFIPPGAAQVGVHCITASFLSPPGFLSLHRTAPSPHHSLSLQEVVQSLVPVTLLLKQHISCHPVLVCLSLNGCPCVTQQGGEARNLRRPVSSLSHAADAMVALAGTGAPLCFLQLHGVGPCTLSTDQRDLQVPERGTGECTAFYILLYLLFYYYFTIIFLTIFCIFFSWAHARSALTSGICRYLNGERGVGGGGRTEGQVGQDQLRQC